MAPGTEMSLARATRRSLKRLIVAAFVGVVGYAALDWAHSLLHPYGARPPMLRSAWHESELLGAVLILAIIVAILVVFAITRWVSAACQTLGRSLGAYTAALAAVPAVGAVLLAARLAYHLSPGAKPLPFIPRGPEPPESPRFLGELAVFGLLFVVSGVARPVWDWRRGWLDFLRLKPRILASLPSGADVTHHLLCVPGTPLPGEHPIMADMRATGVRLAVLLTCARRVYIAPLGGPESEFRLHALGSLKEWERDRRSRFRGLVLSLEDGSRVPLRVAFAPFDVVRLREAMARAERGAGSGATEGERPPPDELN